MYCSIYGVCMCLTFFISVQFAGLDLQDSASPKRDSSQSRRENSGKLTFMFSDYLLTV